MSKRIFDIIGAFMLLLFFFPLMIVIAISIKLSSPGSIIFAQNRVGRNGKLFIIYKFRTFHKNEASCCLGSLVLWKNDPRVSPIGRFLRTRHLDELPQLWNVLKGDMSLVGPRPNTPAIVDETIRQVPHFESRHQVSPGLTGLAQIKGRIARTCDIHQSVGLDLEYVTQAWSPWKDLKILFSTVGVIIRQQGM